MLRTVQSVVGLQTEYCAQESEVLSTTDAMLIERDEGIAILTFNRPERLNAWSSEINEAFLQRLGEAADDPSIRGVVLTGNGRAFSAGADLKNPGTHSVSDPDEYLDTHRGQPVFDALESFEKPIIAAVNGYAVGIGCLVPLCCDFVLASEQAVFCLPQTSLGILPAYGGTLRLARFVGRGNALNIALTGRKVGAEEALQKGIVSHVYPADQLLPEAIATMKAIAAMPPHAVRLTRESLAMGYESGMKAAEKADLYRFMALAQTKDRDERHRAWREARR